MSENEAPERPGGGENSLQDNAQDGESVEGAVGRLSLPGNAEESTILGGSSETKKGDTTNLSSENVDNTSSNTSVCNISNESSPNVTSADKDSRNDISGAGEAHTNGDLSSGADNSMTSVTSAELPNQSAKKRPFKEDDVQPQNVSAANGNEQQNLSRAFQETDSAADDMAADESGTSQAESTPSASASDPPITSSQPEDLSTGGTSPTLLEEPQTSVRPKHVETDASKDLSSSASSTLPGTETIPKPATGSSSKSMEGAAKEDAFNNESAPLQSVYHIKWIRFKGDMTPIVTQNENGPCPLLALMNVLLLKNKIKLPSMVEMVTSGQLMEYLADCIFENAPKNIAEDAQLNYEQNMHDAMAVFHKLQTGLDVNVIFTGVRNFEYTSECIVFDLLTIPLYHGWLVDAEDPNEVAAVSNCSYNQLVEKIIAQKNSPREELVTEALTAEDFLNRTANQLTYAGLAELAASVKDEELCVFFRNNHFSTLYKHKNELFLLVTDQGFLTESNVVWETLANVEGDGHFVDTSFHTYRKGELATMPMTTPAVDLGSDQQIDQDYLVALSLQQEQAAVDPQTAGVAATMDWRRDQSGLTDHEIAVRLQEEEDRRAAAVAQQQAAPNQRVGPGTAHQAAGGREGGGGPTAAGGRAGGAVASPHPGHEQQAGRTGPKEKKSDCVIL